MDTIIIKQLYDHNKVFEGKKIKFFQDPEEIKKHKYVHILRQDEEIVFNIRIFFEDYLFTDKAIYYITAYNNQTNSPGILIASNCSGESSGSCCVTQPGVSVDQYTSTIELSAT